MELVLLFCLLAGVQGIYPAKFVHPNPHSSNDISRIDREAATQRNVSPMHNPEPEIWTCTHCLHLVNCLSLLAIAENLD